MSKKKLGISSFDIAKKFKDKDEARRYAKRLIEFIRYTCNNNKSWSAEAMVVISNTRGNTNYTYYKHDGNVGRPKRVKEFSSYELKYYNNDLTVDWHIHVLLVSKPMYAFRDKIKSYIDKNWTSSDNKSKDVGKEKVYKKNCNIRKMEYFIVQAEDIFFCNFIDKKLVPNSYSLKDLYKAYMKYKTALRYNRTYGNEKRLKLEDDYYKIMNFYWKMTKVKDKKMVQDYMKKLRFSIITNNYDSQDNKVQENLSLHRKEIVEDSYF